MTRKLPLAGVVVLLAMGCNEDELHSPSQDLQVGLDDLSPSADALLPHDDLIACVPIDGGTVPGGGVLCGSDTLVCSGEAPYCCERLGSPGVSSCVAANCGCALRACWTNSECPVDQPLCCSDDPYQIDCRATCSMSLCHFDSDCPPAKPHCRPVTLDGPDFCM